MKAYLQVGIYASFLLVLGIWILLIHFDSRVKQHEDEARLNERASPNRYNLPCSRIYVTDCVISQYFLSDFWNFPTPGTQKVFNRFNVNVLPQIECSMLTKPLT